MLSRLVIAFLPRSKRLLISWLQAPSAVILEPPKIKSVTVSAVSPSICHEVIGPDAMITVESRNVFARLAKGSQEPRPCLWNFYLLSTSGGLGQEKLTPAACSFPGENARSWEALGESRPGQSSLSAGALRYRAWAHLEGHRCPEQGDLWLISLWFAWAGCF